VSQEQKVSVSREVSQSYRLSFHFISFHFNHYLVRFLLFDLLLYVFFIGYNQSLFEQKTINYLLACLQTYDLAQYNAVVYNRNLTSTQIYPHFTASNSIKQTTHCWAKNQVNNQHCAIGSTDKESERFEIGIHS